MSNGRFADLNAIRNIESRSTERSNEANKSDSANALADIRKRFDAITSDALSKRTSLSLTEKNVKLFDEQTTATAQRAKEQTSKRSLNQDQRAATAGAENQTKKEIKQEKPPQSRSSKRTAADENSLTKADEIKLSMDPVLRRGTTIQLLEDPEITKLKSQQRRAKFRAAGKTIIAAASFGEGTNAAFLSRMRTKRREDEMDLLQLGILGDLPLQMAPETRFMIRTNTL